MREATWSDYAAAVRRSWWVLALLVIIPCVAAYAWTASQPKQYRAQSKLLNVSPVTDATTLNLDTGGVGVSIDTPAVLAYVSEKYGGPLPSGGYAVKAASVSMSGDPAAPSALSPTRLVVITVEAPDATVAARLANAFAAGYVAYRKNQARAAARINIKSVKAQLQAFDSAEVAALSDYLASAYVTLQQRLADLEQTARSGNGGYTVAAPASVPSAPFEPQPLRNAVLGLGIGLALAFLAALGLQLFGRRLSHDREAVELLGLPDLGAVWVPRARSGRALLISSDESAGETLEDYRRLRATVLGIMSRRSSTSLLVTSAQEDEGASAVAADLAVLVARSGRSVVAVDGDLRNPTLDKYFSLANDVGLTTVLAGRSTLDDAIAAVSPFAHGSDEEDSGGGRLQVLPSGPAGRDPGETVATLDVASLIRSLAESSDFVVIKGAAMVQAADSVSLAEAADALLFVVDPRLATRKSLKRCKEWLDMLPCSLLGLVLVRSRVSRKERGRSSRRDSARAHSSRVAGSASGLSDGNVR